MTSPYRCPTSCDDDCELNGWGCHEAHAEPKRREHDPAACEARMLAGNLAWMIAADWQVQFGRYAGERGGLTPFWAHLVNGSMRAMTFDGASSGEAVLLARKWAEAEGYHPPTTCTHCGLPVTRGLGADHFMRASAERSPTGWTHLGKSPAEGWQGIRCPGALTGAEPAGVAVP